MHELLELGQSVWLDYLSRGMIRDGELERLIAEGLRGATSNPSIFEHAINHTSDYDALIADPANAELSDRELYEQIALDDVRAAADRFRPIYDATDGTDGFVSLEVSPSLAHDPERSVAEARHLWRELDRPNVMIKIPGTHEGLNAIERALCMGVNINITLLFSVERYQQVADCYINALEARVDAGEPIRSLASVASFFVSRVDTEVDRHIDAKGGSLHELRGRAAIANATLAYARFREIFSGDRWERLERHGARVQRPLWASTSTKNPAYGDVRYVEGLIAPNTVSTMPPETLHLFQDHGVVMRTLGTRTADAEDVMRRLSRGGINMESVAQTLEDQGIRKFEESSTALLHTLSTRRRAVSHEPAPSARSPAAPRSP
jgi:transaldolase